MTGQFHRFIGVDYSGAKTPTDSLKGLRVFVAGRGTAAVEVQPPASPRKYWTRRGVAEWLVDRLREDVPTLVGIDHGFSFPLRYFEAHSLAPDWAAFLDDFHAHWPTDGDHVYVEFVRDGTVGAGASRLGDPHWKRLTDQRARAMSVFQFDVQGSVAKSTHAGLPWLRYVRQTIGAGVHFWPFDGWAVPDGVSTIVEVYPALSNCDLVRRPDETDDQHDARSVAEWLRAADANGTLAQYFTPPLTPEERALASIEGWIFGLMEGRARRSRSPRSRRPLVPKGAVTPQAKGPVDWFWEGHVQACLRDHLLRQSWVLVSEADCLTRQRGIDLVLEQGDRRLAVEVKGYPSTTYRQGPKQGQPKPTQPTLQAKHWFAEALLSAILIRSKHPEYLVATAFPERDRYRKLIASTRDALERLGIGVFLVGETGAVVEEVPVEGASGSHGQASSGREV